MRNHLVLAAALLLSAGCAGPAGSSASISAPPLVSPSPPEASIDLSQGPSASPTPAPTASPASTATVACPAEGEAISVADYFRAVEAEQEGGQACFGSRDVTLLGWADAAPGVGFSPPGIAPGWLWIPTGALWDRNCEEDCAFLWVHLSPEADVEWHADGRWVLVIGHTGDPLAETCHWVYPSDWSGGLRDDRDARERCRGSFVVTAVERTPNVP